MTSDKQKAAWKLSGQRLQGLWDRRVMRSNIDRINDHDKCILGLTVAVVILSLIVITK